MLEDRLTGYEEAEITIRIHPPGEPVPTQMLSNGAPKLDIAQYRSASGTITYRKSKRLRNGKFRIQKRKFVIKKSTMVKEIKMVVSSTSHPLPTKPRSSSCHSCSSLSGLRRT